MAAKRNNSKFEQFSVDALERYTFFFALLDKYPRFKEAVMETYNISGLKCPWTLNMVCFVVLFLFFLALCGVD